MRSAFIKFVVAIIIISCKSSESPKELDYKGFTEKQINLIGLDSRYDLKDSLGFISIKFPQFLDTFYKWTDYSDCTSCGWIKYRFADKKFPQIAESGWMPEIADSVYQLDIWHKTVKDLPVSLTLKPLSEKDTSYCRYHPRIVWSSKPANFLLKEFRIINKRPFIISAFTTSRGQGKFANSLPLFIIAETNLKSRELYFVGECRTKDTTGFIDNIRKSILSIKIEEKQ